MNPRTVRWQACVTVGLLVAVLAVVGPMPVLWLCGAALAFATALNAAYARSLQRAGRPRRRIVGDRWIARYVAFGVGLPLVVAVALQALGYDPSVSVGDFSVSETAAIVIDGATLFVLILSSSLVDWYYIRPRIDGVVCEPPCRSSGSGRWKRPTRWWFLHRGLATLAYMGFALVFALVVMLMLVREHPAAAGVIGGVGGIAGLLLIFAGRYRSEIPTVAQFVLSPAYCLGDDLTYEAHRWKGRGFVLHVAVPVTKLVPLDDAGLPTTGTPFVERKNSDLAEADLSPRTTVACSSGSCARLNPQCVASLPRLDRRRRRLIM
jgi:hypothetical protein